ncbi:MAG: hypothetical protein JXR97_13860 [Planctomycetes bacterium]|nr:hypothetical protein [Planctomycetota bacterium]
MDDIFRECTCGKVWTTRDEFLSDPDISIIGYQARLESITEGIFLFNHLPEDGSCSSTIAFYVADFEDLSRNVYETSSYGSSECEGHCLRMEDLERCNAHCSNAYIREIAVRIKEWKKLQG